MQYHFRAVDWPEPILVIVEHLPSGVRAVSADSFEFEGSNEQWQWFVDNGWAEVLP